jgi:hypothetical protein
MEPIGYGINKHSGMCDRYGKFGNSRHDFLRSCWLLCCVYILSIETVSTPLVVACSEIIESSSHLLPPCCKRYIPPLLLIMTRYPISEGTILLADLLSLPSGIVLLRTWMIRILLSLPLVSCPSLDLHVAFQISSITNTDICPL